MIDMNEPQWYVIQTQFGYESIAKTNLLQMVQINGLQDFIFDVVMPEEEEIVEKIGTFFSEDIVLNITKSYISSLKYKK